MLLNLSTQEIVLKDMQFLSLHKASVNAETANRRPIQQNILKIKENPGIEFERANVMFTVKANLYHQHFSTDKWRKYEYPCKYCKSCKFKADTRRGLKERGLPSIIPYPSSLLLCWVTVFLSFYVCLPHKLRLSCKVEQSVDGLQGILQIYKAVFTNWERRYSLKQININWWHISFRVDVSKCTLKPLTND